MLFTKKKKKKKWNNGKNKEKCNINELTKYRIEQSSYKVSQIKKY